MNKKGFFTMGAAMLLPAGLIYRFMRNRKGALIGMAVGTLVATIAGVLSNLFILFPLYGMTEEAIVGMGVALIPSIKTQLEFVLLITAPFNILKWVVISVLTGIAYKPLSPILHGKRR